MTTPPRPLPPHLIRRADVRVRLAGSAVTMVTTHQTDEEYARKILKEGVRIDAAAGDLSWGIGFYSSTRPDLQYGDVSVSIAIRLERPFVAEDSIDGQEQIDAFCAAAGSNDVRAVLTTAGYDGVILHFGQEETWVIAYNESQVRVVVER